MFDDIYLFLAVKNTSTKTKHKRLSERNCVTCCMSVDQSVPKEVRDYWSQNDNCLQKSPEKENNLSSVSSHHHKPTSFQNN